jgi:hypothetical protein
MTTFALLKRSRNGTQRHLSGTSRQESRGWTSQPDLVRHILNRAVPQPKLTIGAPTDKYEQEADQVAAAVMLMPDGRGKRPFDPGSSAGEHIQRMCPECEEELHRKPINEDEEELLQTKAVPGHTPALAPGVASDIQTVRGGGSLLPESARQFFEPRFGHDFSGVRIYTDERAAESANKINALAYTIGRDIVFGAQQFSPETTTGKSLLAHELTHVVQQGGGSPSSGAGAAPPQVQRLVRTSSVTCPAAATGIANPHTGSSDRRASSLLTTAITRITNAQAVRAASPADPDVVAVGGALNTVFHLDPAVEDSWTGAAPSVRLPVILRRLQAAQSYIDSVVFTINCIPNGGAGYTIPGCANSTCAAGTEAFSCHTNPVEMVLCPDFWALGLDQRGRTWMHEVMHITFGFIDDWGQPNVHNAHCYAQFVALLNGFNSPSGFRCP